MTRDATSHRAAIDQAIDDMTRSQECVACGRPCPPNRRWCSLSCYYAEDGYPDDDRDEAEDDEDA
jgi:hypothetical protein